LTGIGKLPRFGKGVGAFNHFEVYGRGEGGLHFLSITGNAIATADKLQDCQSALAWFYERFIKRLESQPITAETSLIPSPEMDNEEVIRLIRCSKRRPDFERLYDEGKLSGDHSTDDLQLCSMLAFYTQNDRQIYELFKKSALMRD